MVFYPISTLHSWNSRLMPVLGVSLNFLLFWLVCTKTPKEMRVHSRILLQTCYVDFMFLSLYLVVAPVCHENLIIIMYNTFLIILFPAFDFSRLHYDCAFGWIPHPGIRIHLQLPSNGFCISQLHRGNMRHF
jgi:hypothetical protein